MRWTWPLARVLVTSPFALLRRHPVTGLPQPHTGVDLRATTGTEVYAIGDGVVVRSTWHDIAGQWVWIDHGSGVVSRYHHLSTRAVQVGDRVTAGQVIGLSGATGRVTGPHLHHELRVRGVPRDPMPWLTARVTTTPTEEDDMPLTPEDLDAVAARLAPIIRDEAHRAAVGVMRSEEQAQRTKRAVLDALAQREDQ